MPVPDKSKLQAFAKKSATPPMAASALAQKRAAGAKPPPAPGGAPPPAAHAAPAAPPPPGDEQEVHIHELVEEAAQEAEAGHDTELEDAIAGHQSTSPDDVPPWAEDPQKWAEAAQAVGLGGAGHDLYEEPYVVAAYLYKKIGGPVKGSSDLPPPPEAPEGEHHADMSKPGAAASALKARSAAKAPDAGGAPPAAAKPAAPAPGGAAGAPAPKPPPKPADHSAPPPAAKPAPKGAAPAPAGGKPAAPAPAAGKPPAPGAAPTGHDAPPPADEGGAHDELKQIVDQAAQEAESNPDPAIMKALQNEPPDQGMPPSWAADQDKWSKAEEAVKPHWDQYPNPFVVVAHIYKKMGGKIQ